MPFYLDRRRGIEQPYLTSRKTISTYWTIWNGFTEVWDNNGKGVSEHNVKKYIENVNNICAKITRKVRYAWLFTVSETYTIRQNCSWYFSIFIFCR